MQEDSEGVQTLVVGVDAACFPVVEPLIEDGELPTIRSIVDEGSAGTLESQVPPWTASAWPTIYTGKNAGKHGVFDFLSFDGYEWDVVNATHVRERTIWELLSDHGLSSVVVNAPVTHPPRPFDGALIPGITAPEEPTCHPPGLLEDVQRAIGAYHVYPQSTPHSDRSTESYTSVVEQRGRAFRYLVDRFGPDFGFVQFQVTDSIFHERPGDQALVRAVYRTLDDELAATIEACDPRNVVIVSDHGMSSVDGHEFRVNEFLRDAGYVETRKGGAGMPTWTKAWENGLLDGEEDTEGDRTPLETIVAVAARCGLTTQRVANALDLVGLKEPIGRRVPNDLVRAGSEAVDFPASRAYLRSKSELGVRINLAGREPAGVVPQQEYERVRAELVELLSGVRTPDGVPMFDDVAPREAYFEGPEIDRGPDVVLVPADFDNAVIAELEGAHFATPWEAFNHKRDGLVIAAGADVDATASVEGATIFDVAPTLLSLYGLSIDADMDGDPLGFVETTDRREYPAYEPGPIDATDDAFVEDRLSDLGYL